MNKINHNSFFIEHPRTVALIIFTLEDSSLRALFTLVKIFNEKYMTCLNHIYLLAVSQKCQEGILEANELRKDSYLVHRPFFLSQKSKTVDLFSTFVQDL